ncbi:TetR/AcrR family transcriptional regulator [Clostridium sp. PL3]|uniref:TetR/AcrR family transcriptional regulator n=1 Tax=Clostridium thailandense TaxID=2794346 RepID=A0A949TU74_9CLOT|nr:TetR/AcrR family transcriptional regulator [Clostridium thailandense]MBV7273521.1 TetR/AcrR family transcriptional regulator [Clostridium thailandense]
MKNNFKDVPSSKDRILNATLYIIGKDGFQNVTIRKIADIADVNVASINYHFGSKDNVINEALKCITNKFMNSFQLLDDSQTAPIDKLRIFLRSYSDISVEYPDVFKNFVNQLIYNGTHESEYMMFIRQKGSDSIKNVLKDATGIEDNHTLSLMALQIIGSMIFPVLANDHAKFISELNYKDKMTRYDYVELLIRGIQHS